MKLLTDTHGRTIRKLRLSLTDRCNLRCNYCMPLDATFMPESKYLSPAECEEIVAELCDYGLEELRLTGGEPLMRKSFEEIIERLSKLPLRKIGMTTNAVFLGRHLPSLKRNRVQHLNISLDTLKPDLFKSITHGSRLPQVIENIRAAVSMGFHVKINTVAMRGVNDSEFFDLAEFSKELGVELRFLELMRIGFACESQANQFISAGEIMKRLQERYELRPVRTERDSTSFNYQSPCGAQLGFIASESQAFCGHCSRWRLSADGVMRACLLKDAGLSIKGMHSEERAAAYQEVLGMKPFMRPKEVAHRMNAIGG